MPGVPAIFTRTCRPPGRMPIAWFRRESAKRNGVTGWNGAAGATILDVSGGGPGSPSGASGSTLKLQLALPPSEPTDTVYVPVVNGAAGTTTTALSPPSTARAVPEVFAACRTQVGIGPAGPRRVAPAVVTFDGIIAISGNPTLRPPHPQNVRGSGVSAMKRVMLVVAPSPGNTIGVAGRGAPGLLPRRTSSVAAEFHLVLDSAGGLAHMPKAACWRVGLRIPIAWNGPLIQRSMWLRGV